MMNQNLIVALVLAALIRPTGATGSDHRTWSRRVVAESDHPPLALHTQAARASHRGAATAQAKKEVSDQATSAKEAAEVHKEASEPANSDISILGIDIAALTKDVSAYYYYMTLLSAAFSVALWLVVAFLYQKYKVDSSKPAADGLEHTVQLLDGRWRHSIFDCFGDLPLCCISCFFPGLRWADTLRMAGLLAFWYGLAIFVGLYILTELTMGSGAVLFVGVLVYFRQRQRALFGIQNGSCASVAEDVLTYACCGCCAIAQEARQIEEAYAVGHPVALDSRSLDGST